MIKVGDEVEVIKKMSMFSGCVGVVVDTETELGFFPMAKVHLDMEDTVMIAQWSFVLWMEQ